jgi:hypothetical protein
MCTFHAVIRTLEPGCAEVRPLQGLETLKWLLCGDMLFIRSVVPLWHASDLHDTDKFLNYLLIYRLMAVCFEY